MNRNLSLLFVLLITLSIVNAIPFKLNKRVTTFGKCPKGSPLDVSITPDPLVPGGTATFTVGGQLSSPAQTGSMLVIAFFDAAVQPIGTPFQTDLCSITGLTCPLTTLGATGPVQIPAALPAKYAIVVGVLDPAGTLLGCASTAVGVGGAAPPALKYNVIGD